MSVNKNEIKKVVLAYSGGLDTSIIIPWLKENYIYIFFLSYHYMIKQLLTALRKY